MHSDLNMPTSPEPWQYGQFAFASLRSCLSRLIDEGKGSGWEVGSALLRFGVCAREPASSSVSFLPELSSSAACNSPHWRSASMRTASAKDSWNGLIPVGVNVGNTSLVTVNSQPTPPFCAEVLSLITTEGWCDSRFKSSLTVSSPSPSADVLIDHQPYGTDDHEDDRDGLRLAHFVSSLPRTPRRRALALPITQ